MSMLPPVLTIVFIFVSLLSFYLGDNNTFSGWRLTYDATTALFVRTSWLIVVLSPKPKH